MLYFLPVKTNGNIPCVKRKQITFISKLRWNYNQHSVHFLGPFQIALWISGRFFVEILTRQFNTAAIETKFSRAAYNISHQCNSTRVDNFDIFFVVKCSFDVKKQGKMKVFGRFKIILIFRLQKTKHSGQQFNNVATVRCQTMNVLFWKRKVSFFRYCKTLLNRRLSWIEDAPKGLKNEI